VTFEAWTLFCLTETVLCLQPGPAALVVVSQALARGTGAGVRASTGVLAANAVYFALSASGLVALHARSAEAFSAIRWVGAAYLLWLSARSIRRSFAARDADAPRDAAAPAGRSFWRGFLAQGANPNLLVYFAAILPQFIDPRAPVAPQVAILAVSSFAIEMTVLSAWSGLSGRAGEAAAPRLRAWLERLGGGLLIAAAAGLARTRASDG
jgi:homoserine/homoserine lactone efflux protein